MDQLANLANINRNKASSQEEIEFEQNLLRLQESVNRRKKWRMNDFIRKKILRQTIENKIIFYKETQQLQKNEYKTKYGNLENPIKSNVNIKRDFPLRSISYNDFDLQNNTAVRSMPEFSDSVQKMQLNQKASSKNKHDTSFSPTNAIMSPDLPNEINELVVAGVNIKEAKLKRNKEKIKALRQYFKTKPKSESDGLPIIREQTELQLPSKVSPCLYIDKKPQAKILPKIGLVSRAPLSDSYYKGYYASSFQLFSNNSGNTSLPVINLNKLTIMNPNKTIEHAGFDQKSTNYSKFINNLKNKSLNYDKTIDIDTGDEIDAIGGGSGGGGGGGGCSVIDIISDKTDVSNESITSNNKLNKLNINFSMQRNVIKNISS